MGFGNLGISELLIVAVLVLLLFGPRRLPEMARSAGRILRQLRRGVNEVRRELDEMDRPARSDRAEREDGGGAPSGEVRPRRPAGGEDGTREDDGGDGEPGDGPAAEGAPAPDEDRSEGGAPPDAGPSR